MPQNPAGPRPVAPGASPCPEAPPQRRAPGAGGRGRAGEGALLPQGFVLGQKKGKRRPRFASPPTTLPPEPRRPLSAPLPPGAHHGEAGEQRGGAAGGFQLGTAQVELPPGQRLHRVLVQAHGAPGGEGAGRRNGSAGTRRLQRLLPTAQRGHRLR